MTFIAWPTTAGRAAAITTTVQSVPSRTLRRRRSADARNVDRYQLQSHREHQRAELHTGWIWRRPAATRPAALRALPRWKICASASVMKPIVVACAGAPAERPEETRRASRP